MAHIPSAVYRLQFTPEFPFSAALPVVRYLAELGVSDLYASPVFQARPGSRHGYDIIDPNAINPELGGMGDFVALLGKVKEAGLFWLQDIVPNHLAFDGENRMIRGILEQGPDSSFCRCFDIDWEHPSPILHGKLLVPFLGGFYSECLEAGEIKLVYDCRGFAVRYHDLCLPLRIDSYREILEHGLSLLEKRLGEDHPDAAVFRHVLRCLPPPPSMEPVLALTRKRITELKNVLWQTQQENPVFRKHLGELLELYNGVPGQPESFDLLDKLLCRQHFRLSYWKFANEEINYRRFFTINELISVRVEDPQVFDEVHRLIDDLAGKKLISGLRVDHVDGLYDPTAYLQRLRSRHEEAYILVEKILAPEEELPSLWPIQGTTGYDFLNQVNGLFVDPAGEGVLDRFYAEITAGRVPYHVTLLEKKRHISGKHLAGNIDNLARYLKKISVPDRYGRDITPYGLKRVLVEVLAHFSVYRTYVNGAGWRDTDPALIRSAVEETLKENRGMRHEVEFIERYLLRAFDASLPPAEREGAVGFVMRLQQLTGPLMAKAVEDTLFYTYNRFLALNEVGSEPGRFGVAVDRFHDFNHRRLETFPHSLSATSSHDTKRGEDVRARLAVLSEIPREWREGVRVWKRLNGKKKRAVGGFPAPDANEEYFLYQTLIGAYPFDPQGMDSFRERIRDHMVKAIREAKVHSDWLNPDEEYEAAVKGFVDMILDDAADNPFLRSFLPLQRKVAHLGMVNSLAQTLIKIASPGVPDFYQGSELWDLRLVDPDNRGPVDFGLRLSCLQRLRQTSRAADELLRELMDSKEDGRLKLHLIQRALHARRDRQDLFACGDYIPLPGAGRCCRHLITFARRYGDGWAVAVAPRLPASLMGGQAGFPVGDEVWGDTTVPLPREAPRVWEEVISGTKLECHGKIDVGRALRLFPVALLLSAEGKP